MVVAASERSVPGEQRRLRREPRGAARSRLARDRGEPRQEKEAQARNADALRYTRRRTPGRSHGRPVANRNVPETPACISGFGNGFPNMGYRRIHVAGCGFSLSPDPPSETRRASTSSTSPGPRGFLTFQVESSASRRCRQSAAWPVPRSHHRQPSSPQRNGCRCR